MLYYILQWSDTWLDYYATQSIYWIIIEVIIIYVS